MVGVPGTYIGKQFDGHKAPPGTYSAELKMGNIRWSTLLLKYCLILCMVQVIKTMKNTMPNHAGYGVQKVNRMHLMINDMNEGTTGSNHLRSYQLGCPFDGISEKDGQP